MRRRAMRRWIGFERSINNPTALRGLIRGAFLPMTAIRRRYKLLQS
jgi:hypothetical protein